MVVDGIVYMDAVAEIGGAGRRENEQAYGGRDG